MALQAFNSALLEFISALRLSLKGLQAFAGPAESLSLITALLAALN